MPEQVFQTRLLDPVQSQPYDPTDYTSVNQRLLDNTKNAFGQRFPIENESYALSVEGLEYDGYQPTLKDEKKAILRNASVTKKLKGRWVLTNKETGEIKRSNPRILMNVPYMTRRGTFIRNGSEQSINYMFRLTPGVYSRKKDNGMYEAHVNPKQGTGGQFKIELEPKSGIFRVRKGTRGYKLYPMLKRAGMTDDQMKRMWGADLLDVNRQASDLPNPNKKYVGGVSKQASDRGSEYDEILEALTKAELDPVATEITLGKRYDKVTPETLLDASTKVLNMSQGKTEGDYRDSLEFQKIDGPADYFAERIIRDGGGLARNILWRASKRGNFDDIPTAPMNKHVDAIFNESRHAAYIDGSSPFSGIDLSTKITRIGEGGISGVRTAPSETRAVQDTFAGFIDPVRSVESLRVGLDMYLANGVRKGDDGRLYSKMVNAKTGKEEWVDSLKAARGTIATHNEAKSSSKFVPAIRGSKGVGVVRKEDVDYYIMDDSRMYSLGSNSVPGKNGIMSNRLQMGGKYGVQAMPLVHREAPLVRSRQGDTTNEDVIGRKLGIERATEGGRVVSVDADKIVVDGPGGKKSYELYDNHPFNQKGYLRSIPQVKVGDQIKSDQVLATTNYTDDKGVAAQGTNLRVAFMPWKGMNFEDAITISETAAKKLSTEKMYKNRLPVSSNTDFSKKAFMGKFPSKFTKEQMKTIGDNGVAKKGTVLREGDPMIIAVRQNDPKPGSLGRKTKTALMETWDHKYEGVVVGTDIGDKHATVYTRANLPMKTGDKMSNRYAAKGVVNVLPDNEMPLDADGEPVDVVANSLGIISRVNPMQVVEAMAGKLARKTGKPEVIDAFSEVDMIDLYEQKLKDAGVAPNESLYDPATGREIPEVLVGDSFFYRLMHLAEDKGRGRGTGAVTGEDTPLRGGKSGAKQMGGLHTSALVSHGAMKVVKDAKLIRGQANDEFWRDFRMGRMPKMPGKSLVNEKFYKHLQAAGLNIDENSDRINFFGMTNEQARKLSKGHELKIARTFNQKTMNPVDGGLFDPKLFGPNGNDWAFIQLDEPMPNPVMEPAIASILKLSQKNFNQVMAGEREINGRTGGEAVKAALSNLKMDHAVKDSLLDLKSSTPSKKDKALKRYRFLKSMDEQGVEPKDFMMERVPVLPPKFRPVTQAAGTNISADANIMYRSLMFSRDDLREAKDRLPDDKLKSARKNMYNSYKALTGMYDPDDAKLEEKNVQGLLKWIFGKGSAKRGAYQRRILGTAMNITGSGTVTPNPSLKLDEIGLPIKQAWDVYEPFVVRSMVRNGYEPTTAIRMVKDRNEKALKHLQEVSEERPVIVNRAPTLHKYGVMAFKPKLVKGNTVQVPPSIVGPYGMDFDGDSVTYYVPVSKDAVDEAYEKMLPTKNLLSPRSMTAHYTPSQEFIQGLYLATRAKKEKPKKTFRTTEEAQAAYNKGEIDIDTPIVILETS
jgi:DNA-directed RNA polymerase beta subunit